MRLEPADRLVDDDFRFGRLRQLAVDDRYMDLYPEFILSPEEKAAYNSELQAAVIGAKLAKRFDWKIGDRITLLGSPYSGPEGWDFIIRGIYHGRERTTDETTMFFHWKMLNERLSSARGPFNQVGWYLIGIDKPGDTGVITKGVDDLFFNSSSPTLTETEKAFNQSFVSMMGSIITVIKTAAWIVIGIILLIMINTMGMSSRERTSEYGILKTLGYRAGHLVALITGESVLVTLAGAGLGCLLAYGMVSVVGVGIEEQMGPGFPAKDFFPEFDAETFAAEQHWLALRYYIPESGRLLASIHSWLVRTGKYTVLIDACSGNHKPRPGMPRFDMLTDDEIRQLHAYIRARAREALGKRQPDDRAAPARF